MNPVSIDAFESLVRSRRATRHFRSDPVSREVIHRIIDIAHWSPSGYNLQPTHYFIVTEDKIKSDLQPACMNQAQIKEAPCIIVLSGDRDVVNANFETIVRLENEAGAMNPQYEKILRKYVGLAFSERPWGLGRWAKAIGAPLMRIFQPTPSIPAVHKRYWLTKQVMLSAMTLMLAAEAQGLQSSPMEGFDEGRVKKVLGIPRHHIIPVIIALGYREGGVSKKSRLKTDSLIHYV